MSMLKLPNEILADIFKRLQPIDIDMVKRVNRRFKYVTEEYKIELPIAIKLKVTRVLSIMGGWKPQIDIEAEVIVRKATDNGIVLKVEKIDKGVHTEGNNANEDTYCRVARALLEMKIRGCRELKVDFLTVEFDFMAIFNKIGFNYRKIVSVHRKFDVELAVGICISLPFMTDKWLRELYKNGHKSVQLNSAKTKISLKGLLNILEDRLLVTERESSHFGMFEMTNHDHKVMNEFSKSHSNAKVDVLKSIYNQKRKQVFPMGLC